jgi:hypothetical protein
MTRPFFNKVRVTDFDIFERHASDAIGQAVKRLSDGYPINIEVRTLDHQLLSLNLSH